MKYRLTRSIIHNCPALVVDTSLEQLAGVVRIIALKGAMDDDADIILAALRAPADARSAWLEAQESAVQMVECEFARDKDAARRLKEIAAHIHGIKCPYPKSVTTSSRDAFEIPAFLRRKA